MPILGIIASQNYPRITSSYESIATVTVGSGGTSTISFTSIPATFTHLQLRIFARDTTAANQSMAVTFNSDTGSNYSSHRLYGSGSGVGADAQPNASLMLLGVYTNDGDNFSPTVADILDYANTNKYKTLRTLSGWDNNSSGRLFCMSGSWRSTSAVTAITITPETHAFTQYSSFALYGIKG
jgi:hypothetical protein